MITVPGPTISGEGPADTCCERCGKPIIDRVAAWLQGADGRLRIAALDALDPHATEGVRVWHAGCLHSGTSWRP